MDDTNYGTEHHNEPAADDTVAAGGGPLVLEGEEREAAPLEADTPEVEPGNEVFPVPFARFAATLRHTDDEVWLKHMQLQHGRENHTVDEWRALIDQYRNEPAHPGP